MTKLKPSILRNLFLSFLGFGFCMGLIFPFYAQFFVSWKDGMQIWFNIGCVIAGVMIGITNYVLVKMVLLNKLRMISSVAQLISHHDITHECHIRSHDVVGQIIDSFNSMTRSLRDMIGAIADVSDKMDDAAHDLEQATQETLRFAEAQHAQTDLVAASMSQMSAAIHQVSTTAEEAASTTRAADHEADDGRQIVDHTLTVINNLAESVENGGAAVQRLQHDTNNISAVLDVIKSIAEQTNLLALNAAIEAARAGEQGRGFAVVADEVRSLASRTQQSTEEIQAMIERLQAGAAGAVKEMQCSQQLAHEVVQEAAKTGGSLQTLIEAVNRIKQMNQHISSAVETQDAMSDEINQNVAMIKASSQDSVSQIQLAAKAGEGLCKLSEQLRSLIHVYKM